MKLKLKMNFDTKTIKKHIPKMTTINLYEKTKEQSLNPIWMYHGVGRITASTAGEVYKTNIDITS